jgi:hypothetical protein
MNLRDRCHSSARKETHQPQMHTLVLVGDLEEVADGDHDALDALSSSYTARGMRCSTGRMENGLCGSVWYQ